MRADGATHQTKAARGKNSVQPHTPYHFLHEQEISSAGELQEVNTIFLTSKECSFDCLMCDLWKNTLDGVTPGGAIVQQIDHALQRLPPADVIKLYNSGNFFDVKAVPPDEYASIADRVSSSARVVVENHPNLCGENCIRFRDEIDGTLEVAMGLETIHPTALSALNKQMTLHDFSRAAGFLRRNDIDMRAFVLLSPPYLTERHLSIEWTLKTVAFAFECGAGACSIIPTRATIPKMHELMARGEYAPPSMEMIEQVFDQALALRMGRVFVDTWDLGIFASCRNCAAERIARIQRMNFQQRFLPPVHCTCGTV